MVRKRPLPLHGKTGIVAIFTVTRETRLKVPMRDPHVVSLIYKLKTQSTLAYNSPSALTVSTAEFNARLD